MFLFNLKIIFYKLTDLVSNFRKGHMPFSQREVEKPGTRDVSESLVRLHFRGPSHLGGGSIQ